MSKPNRNTKQITKEELDILDYNETVQYCDGFSEDRDLQYYLPL